MAKVHCPDGGREGEAGNWFERVHGEDVEVLEVRHRCDLDALKKELFQKFDNSKKHAPTELCNLFISTFIGCPQLGTRTEFPYNHFLL